MVNTSASYHPLRVPKQGNEASQRRRAVFEYGRGMDDELLKQVIAMADTLRDSADEDDRMKRMHSLAFELSKQTRAEAHVTVDKLYDYRSKRAGDQQARDRRHIQDMLQDISAEV